MAPGAAPAVHIPVVEKFVGRLAEKMGSGEGALLFEIINRGASAHFVGGIPIGDSRAAAPSTPTCACSASRGCTSWTAASCRPTPE